MTTEIAPKPRKPRQFSQRELDTLFPIDCTIAADGVVRVARTWEQQNLRKIRFPAAFGIQSAFNMHKDAAPVFQEWFRMIGDADLRREVMTFNGSYVPRLKRGANVPKTRAGLSRHSRGLALDLNAAWNPMGKQPAAVKEIGSVRRIAELAAPLGIVWGGDWSGASIDGMHFELGTFDP